MPHPIDLDTNAPKEHYSAARAPHQLESAITELFAYCETNDWAGYDPYDVLNSRAFEALPFLNARWPRLALIQAFKRSPINLRRIAGVPKTQNPKAIALFLSATLKLGVTENSHHANLLKYFIDRLIALRSPESSYWCWGYSFPWQTRAKLVPRSTPNLVCTVFVAGALLDAYEILQDKQCLDMAISAAKYIVDELYWSDGTAASFCYPLPSILSRIHNANFLAAALLCRVATHTGEEAFTAPALKVARYSAAQQRANGSWTYGEEPSQQWIDNFHTGYNLCALQAITESGVTDEFASATERGFQFYREHFIKPSGAVRYFHDRDYPVDIHCIAQTVITLITLNHLSTDYLSQAEVVSQWALEHMRDDAGFFYYRKLRAGTIRTSYMRWSQAWMLLALAALRNEYDGRTTKPLSPGRGTDEAFLPKR